jgi:hypothetical protein
MKSTYRLMQPIDITEPIKKGLRVREALGLDDLRGVAHAESANPSGCDCTTQPAQDVNTVPNRYRLPPGLAVRGTSVRGRVPSAPLRKANWLADRLHSIGRFDGRRQSIPGKWTRWGLSEGQEGEPIRTEAMGGPAGSGNHEGVPKAIIRRVLTKERKKR